MREIYSSCSCKSLIAYKYGTVYADQAQLSHCKKNLLRGLIYFAGFKILINFVNVKVTNSGGSGYLNLKKPHIKANWETHQIYQKYRDKLALQWRAPRRKTLPLPGAQGGLQSLASTQILSFGVSSHSFGVVLISR